MKKRALLLAAGLGTRLKPITDNIPKCMVPINGVPLLQIWFDMLSKAGFEKTLVNTHYFSKTVEDYIAALPNKDQIDTVYEEELLGTGGTLVANRDFFDNHPLLLAHADNLTDFDPAQLFRQHEERPPNCVITMLAFETDDPRSCGILDIDAQSIVVGFYEKVANPPGNLANAAVYIIEPEVIDFAEALNKSFIDLSTEIIPNFIGRIKCVVHKGYHRDIGNPEAYQKALEEFPLRNQVQISSHL